MKWLAIFFLIVFALMPLINFFSKLKKHSFIAALGSGCLTLILDVIALGVIFLICYK
jgi:hypothetical protein